MNFKGLSFLFLVLTSVLSWSQNEVANNLIVDGNEAHEQAEYIDAEAQYRKAVSLAPEKSEALHNLGNTNYRIEDYSAASQRFFQTQKNTTSKNEKHAAFHNLGNVYMQQKDYAQAVAAFKNGLRNNPTDEETRYNYALAKELLEKEQQQDQQDEQNQDNQDQDQDKEGDQEKKDEKGDQEDPKDEGEDKDKKEGEDGESEDDSKEKPEEDKPKNPEKEGEGDEKKQPPPQPKPGQISPEQVKSLLEAMNNQEKGVQEKVNAQKVKGTPVKTKKDW
ncbi:tetratricopeptide repeat protein [Flavobacteriaceae bacterium]|nr:tetratricopeptide repeat protein [Flavobacteriaceae bacterium]